MCADDRYLHGMITASPPHHCSPWCGQAGVDAIPVDAAEEEAGAGVVGRELDRCVAVAAGVAKGLAGEKHTLLVTTPGKPKLCYYEFL